MHLDLNEDLPTVRYYVEINIPEDIEILELKHKDLPEDWDSKPPILETQFIGDDFVNDNEAAVLKVPSSIVKSEFNYLINPNHPDSKKITVVSKIPLKFDERLKQTKKDELEKN
ncbi:hypothetical protein DET49_10346 [Salegentibacter sp. 24]|nr:hypothetical protein DET49_10346 [Salegentibacter sp. 24]